MYNLHQALQAANKKYFVSNDMFIVNWAIDKYEIYNRETGNVVFADNDLLLFDVVGKQAIKRNWRVRDSSN